MWICDKCIADIYILLYSKKHPYICLLELRKILNLISQAKPVAITPKYNNDKIEIKVGLDFQGVSTINEKGNKNITDHNVGDVVTFSFFSNFNCKVNKPPMQ